MLWLKTVFDFFIVGLIVVGLTPFGIAMCLLNALGLRRLAAWGGYRIVQALSRFMIFLTGVTLRVEGQEKIPRQGGFCLVSNHGSIFDIILILALTGRPVGFIAKRELARIPLLNMWVLLLGGLFIDRRQNRRSIRRAMATIERGVRRIQAGGAMIIFPEGTRSRGQGLLPFKPGALKLATKSLAPIVPLAITGSYDVFERKRRVRAVPVRVVYCDPIDTASLPLTDRKQALADHLHAVIAERSAKLTVQSPATRKT